MSAYRQKFCQRVPRDRSSYQRTTKKPGYQISQKIRKHVEEDFGWKKTVGGFRKSLSKGIARTQLCAYFVGAACNSYQPLSRATPKPPIKIENRYRPLHQRSPRRLPERTKYDFRPQDKLKPVKKLVDPVLIATADKLKTKEGKVIYRKRAITCRARIWNHQTRA